MEQNQQYIKFVTPRNKCKGKEWMFKIPEKALNNMGTVASAFLGRFSEVIVSGKKEIYVYKRETTKKATWLYLFYFSDQRVKYDPDVECPDISSVDWSDLFALAFDFGDLGFYDDLPTELKPGMKEVYDCIESVCNYPIFIEPIIEDWLEEVLGCNCDGCMTRFTEEIYEKELQDAAKEHGVEYVNFKAFKNAFISEYCSVMYCWSNVDTNVFKFFVDHKQQLIYLNKLQKKRNKYCCTEPVKVLQRYVTSYPVIARHLWDTCDRHAILSNGNFGFKLTNAVVRRDYDKLCDYIEFKMNEQVMSVREYDTFVANLKKTDIKLKQLKETFRKSLIGDKLYRDDPEGLIEAHRMRIATYIEQEWKKYQSQRDSRHAKEWKMETLCQTKSIKLQLELKNKK